MAIYLLVLPVVAAGDTWLQAVLGVLLATAAVLVSLAASRWWGHHLSRLLSHPDAELLLLRVLGATLIVAALARGRSCLRCGRSIPLGLTLTGQIADRARPC